MSTTEQSDPVSHIRVCPACHEPAAGQYCMHCSESLVRSAATTVDDLHNGGRNVIDTNDYLWNLLIRIYGRR